MTSETYRPFVTSIHSAQALSVSKDRSLAKAPHCVSGHRIEPLEVIG